MWVFLVISHAFYGDGLLVFLATIGWCLFADHPTLGFHFYPAWSNYPQQMWLALWSLALIHLFRQLYYDMAQVPIQKLGGIYNDALSYYLHIKHTCTFPSLSLSLSIYIYITLNCIYIFSAIVTDYLDLEDNIYLSIEVAMVS